MTIAASILDLPQIDERALSDTDEPFAELFGADEPERFAAFVIGGKSYCLAAGLVEAIADPLVTAFIPKAPRAIAGIAPYLGESVVVLDIHDLLEIATAPAPPRHSIILRPCGHGTRAAFPVDRVLQVIEARPANIRPAEGLSMVDAVIALPNGSSFFRLDISTILAHLEKA